MPWLVTGTDSHHWGHDVEARQVAGQKQAEENFGAEKGWRPRELGHPRVSACHWADARMVALDTYVPEHRLASDLDYYLVQVNTVLLRNIRMPRIGAYH